MSRFETFGEGVTHGEHGALASALLTEDAGDDLAVRVVCEGWRGGIWVIGRFIGDALVLSGV